MSSDEHGRKGYVAIVRDKDSFVFLSSRFAGRCGRTGVGVFFPEAGGRKMEMQRIHDWFIPWAWFVHPDNERLQSSYFYILPC
jgi:hypothetical protein